MGDSPTELERLRRRVDEHDQASLVGPDGSIRGLYGISTDVTALHQTRDQLSEGEQRLRQILDSLFGFVGLYTVDGVVLETNRAPLVAAGIEAKDVIGQPLWDTYWWNYDPPVQHRIREAMERAAKGAVVRFEVQARVMHGQMIDLDISFGPMRSADDTITGIIGFAVDVTERTQVAHELRQSEERLRLTLEASGQATWELDLETMTAKHDPRYAQIIGIDGDSPMTRNSATMAADVHPADLETTRSAFSDYLAGASPRYETEFRMRTEANGWKWIRAIGTIVERDGDGRPLRMLGTHTDIDARKRAEDALRTSEERFRLSFETTAIGAVMVGMDGRFIKTNRAFDRIIGFSSAELRSKTFQEITHPDDVQMGEDAFRDLVAGRRQSVHLEKRYVTADGRTIWASVSSVMVRGPLDDPLYAVAHVSDITDAREARQREQLLIQELNHRVKNAMATVTGLASATAMSATSVAEFVSRFSRRIEAMAELHETLARQQWTDLGLEQLVHTTIAAGGDAVTIAGSAVTLSARVAMPIGQALFELMTNAVRHGSLSVPEGRVDIRWAQTDAGSVRLVWTESMGPEIQGLPQPGVGHELMTGLMEQEIGGKLAIDFDPAGVCAALEFPAE